MKCIPNLRRILGTFGIGDDHKFFCAIHVNAWSDGVFAVLELSIDSKFQSRVSSHGQSRPGKQTKQKQTYLIHEEGSYL